MNLLFAPQFWFTAALWTVTVALGGYWKGTKDERADWTARQLQAERQARGEDVTLGRELEDEDEGATSAEAFFEQQPPENEESAEADQGRGTANG